MGFFSFKTCDKNQPINNSYSKRPSGTVYMLQPNGLPPIKETSYEGYGVFGGVDCYAWLARMNITGIDKSLPDDDIRGEGIEIGCIDNNMGKLKYPLKFSFNENAVYENLPYSQSDENQGFFYD